MKISLPVVSAILLLVLLESQTSLVSACHGGYSHGSGSETEVGLIDEDYGSFNQSEINGGRKRKKRELEQYDDLIVLRKYFSDCMLDKIGLIWDWKSVVDFSIVNSLWFFYSSTVACSENKGKDDVACWQMCLEVYLRDNSSLLQPSKECVVRYAEDFIKRVPVYKSATFKGYRTEKSSLTEYGKCVLANLGEETYIFDRDGNLLATVQQGIDINSIISFIQRDAKCSICDYGYLPGTQVRANVAENLFKRDGTTSFYDGESNSVEYVTRWPFKFEALIRRDSELRKATSVCNVQFAPTFVKDPPPDLTWGEWNEWLKCNGRCTEVGYQQRSRVCLAKNRDRCLGNAVESRTCYNLDCAHWAEWGAWTPCHASCGVSVQMSFRTCQNLRMGEEGCEGDFKRSRNCIMKQCPVPWSQWSACSVTCGYEGFQTRSGGPNLLDVKVERRICGKSSPCVGDWSVWEQWNECSATCGYAGRRKRIRSCPLAMKCDGSNEDISLCNLKPCGPTWSNWADWSACAYRRRTRTCLNGPGCPGNTAEFQQCSGSDCNQESHHLGTWSVWTRWTSCNSVCGLGQQIRYRKCIQTNLSVTKGCTGRAQESRYCRRNHCFGFFGKLQKMILQQVRRKP